MIDFAVYRNFEHSFRCCPRTVRLLLSRANLLTQPTVGRPRVFLGLGFAPHLPSPEPGRGSFPLTSFVSTDGMSPKRNYAESSDDEFRLSDKSASPQPSRLKRSRRRSGRDHVPSSLSPRDSSFQDDKAGIIDISGSLEDENDIDLVLSSPIAEENAKGNLSADKYDNAVKGETRNLLVDENSRDAPTDPPSPRTGGPDVSFLDQVQDEDSRVAESLVESLAESVAESAAGSAAGSATTPEARNGTCIVLMPNTEKLSCKKRLKQALIS